MDKELIKAFLKDIIIKEGLTPDQSSKVMSKYDSIYKGMLKGDKKKLMKYTDPKFNRPNPDAMAMGRAINLVKKDSDKEEVNEARTDLEKEYSQYDSFTLNNRHYIIKDIEEYPGNRVQIITQPGREIDPLTGDYEKSKIFFSDKILKRGGEFHKKERKKRTTPAWNKGQTSTTRRQYEKILKGAMGDAAGMGDEEFTYDMATSMIHDPEISSYLDKEYPRLGRNAKLKKLQYDLEMYLQESVNEITPAQQRYVDMAASKPSKPKKTQFRKDIEGAKRMIDAGKSEEDVINRYGIAAFNAVNAENEYLQEKKLTKAEKDKKEDIIMAIKKKKGGKKKLTDKDYAIATSTAKKVAESAKEKSEKNYKTYHKNKDKNRLTELIKDALKNPKKADLDKDGKLSDYEKKRGASIEKSMLKEYTDNNFSGAKLISKINKPDIFGQQAFDELFPLGAKSEMAAIRALKNYDLIRFPSPMFVYVAATFFEDEAGEKYKVLQTQFYNSNFQDARNPRVTALALTKLADPNNPSPQSQEDIRIGTMLVKTDEYVKDFKNLNTLKTISESVNGSVLKDKIDRDNLRKIDHKLHELSNRLGGSMRIQLIYDPLFTHAVYGVNPDERAYVMDELNKIGAKNYKTLKAQMAGTLIIVFDASNILSNTAGEMNRNNLAERILKKLREGKEERTSTVSKSRAKAEVKDIEKGKRSDGMGKPTAKVYAVKDGKEIELKTLKDFNKHSSGYTYKLK